MLMIEQLRDQHLAQGCCGMQTGAAPRKSVRAAVVWGFCVHNQSCVLKVALSQKVKNPLLFEIDPRVGKKKKKKKCLEPLKLPET